MDLFHKDFSEKKFNPNTFFFDLYGTVQRGQRYQIYAVSTLTFFLRREKNTHPSSSFGNKSSFPDNVCSASSSWSYSPGWVSSSCLCLDKYKIRRSLYTHRIMRSLVNNSRLLLSNIIVFQICLLELVEAKINEFLLFSVTESWGPANGFRLCCHLQNCLKLSEMMSIWRAVHILL